MCVSMHLECWLGKTRVEIVTWAKWVWHANSNSVTILVLKFGSVNAIDVDSIRIQCALSECKFSSHSNRIQCERPLLLRSMNNLWW